MSEFKLAIAEEVEVPINFTTTNAGRPATFKFKLVCKRLSVDELEAEVKGEPERKQGDFMLEITTGWKDQRLVLGEDGQPAEFSTEALRAAFNGVQGLGELAYAQYRQEIGARGKN